MQSPYGNSMNQFIYQQQTQRLFNVVYSNRNSEQLLLILSDQKQVIEKLLENQNVLKHNISIPSRSQTTDTQHNINDSEPYRAIRSIQQGDNYCKKINTILLSQQKQCQIAFKHGQKRSVEIICNCPESDSRIEIDLQQYSEKVQSEKHREQNKKGCQTKNIIKNYGKSILTFLKKNEALTKKILEEYQYQQNQFYETLQIFKGKVNSITDLKAFWSNQGNRFAKIFRIISNIYLKKHSLKHTFSSRVRNYGIHIKYRKRLLDILKNPQGLSSLKYI